MGLLNNAMKLTLAKRRAAPAKAKAGVKTPAIKKKPSSSGLALCKRPAAEDLTLCKRPAALQEPPQTNDVTSDDDPLVKEEPSDDELAFDASTITPQQRHVWQKAVKVPTGMPGGVPEEVMAEYNRAQGPKQRAMVVNAFVGKEVGYGSQINFSATQVERFVSSFTMRSDTVKVLGQTFTDLRSELGHGNLAAGEQAITEGLASGDIVLKNGLYIRSSQLQQKTKEVKEGRRHKGYAESSAADWP